VVEGARLESVFRGNSNVGSNPTLSAITRVLPRPISLQESNLPAGKAALTLLRLGVY
jgi:hypothetical protein